MIQAKDLCAYAQNAVGGGYCWGASGEICSPSFRQELALRAPNQAENLLGECAKWDGKRVWDCSGLLRGAWRALSSYRSGGATTIFNIWCKETGTIDTLPDIPGIALFKANPKEGMDHVGIYIGKDQTIDARGSRKGVVADRLAAYEWTHWGRLENMVYEDASETREENPLENKLFQPPLWTAHVRTITGNGISLWTDTAKTQAVTEVPEGAELSILCMPMGTNFVMARWGLAEGWADIRYLIPSQREVASEFRQAAQQAYEILGKALGI